MRVRVELIKFTADFENLSDRIIKLFAHNNLQQANIKNTFIKSCMSPSH